MNPMTLLLLGLGGTALSSLGSTINGNSPYKDITADWLKTYNNGNRDLNWQNSSRLLQALYGGGALDPQSYLSKATGYNANASDIYNSVLAAMNPGGRYSAKGMQDSYLAAMPGVNQIATDAARGSTSRAGSSMEDLAKLVSARTVNNMTNSLGGRGLFGAAAGPVAASISMGAQEPLMQAQTAINQLYSDAYNKAYSPAAQMAGQTILQEPTNQLNIGQLFKSMADSQYSAAAPLLQMLQGLSEQNYLAPQFKQSPSFFGTLLEKLGNFGSQMGSFGLGQGWDGNLFNKVVTPGSTGIPKWLNIVP